MQIIKNNNLKSCPISKYLNFQYHNGLINQQDRYVCVCVCVVWCSGCVLGSGPDVLEFKPHSGNFNFFHLVFPSPPVHPAVIGYLAFAIVQIQGHYSWNSNCPGGTSGAHTTCCDGRPFSCEFLVIFTSNRIILINLRLLNIWCSCPTTD